MVSIPDSYGDFIKEQIDTLRERIGREVTVYTATLSACSLCSASGYLDPIKNQSFFFTCPVCKGAYWIKGEEANVIIARVHWIGDEAIGVTPAGKYYVGDATFHCDPEYRPILEKAQSEGRVLVDDVSMQIQRIDPLGALTINRLRVVLRRDGK